MNTPSPSRWADLFEIAISIIDQVNSDFTKIDRWTLGGGTALMLHIKHRESHDVDLFIDDPQLLPYLNPETQEFELSIQPSSYETDGTRALKIVFDGVGEIDVICCGWLLENYAAAAEVQGRTIQLETPAEIIAKKVYYRGYNLQVRDMFDIAAVAQRFGEDYLIDTLGEFPDEVRRALKVAKGFNSELAGGILDGLNVLPEFEDVRKTARNDTIEVLEASLSRLVKT